MLFFYIAYFYSVPFDRSVYVYVLCGRTLTRTCSCMRMRARLCTCVLNIITKLFYAYISMRQGVQVFARIFRYFFFLLLSLAHSLLIYPPYSCWPFMESLSLSHSIPWYATQPVQVRSRLNYFINIAYGFRLHSIWSSEQKPNWFVSAAFLIRVWFVFISIELTA